MIDDTNQSLQGMEEASTVAFLKAKREMAQVNPDLEFPDWAINLWQIAFADGVLWTKKVSRFD